MKRSRGLIVAPRIRQSHKKRKVSKRNPGKHSMASLIKRSKNTSSEWKPMQKRMPGWKRSSKSPGTQIQLTSDTRKSPRKDRLARRNFVRNAECPIDEIIDQLNRFQFSNIIFAYHLCAFLRLGKSCYFPMGIAKFIQIPDLPN